VVQASSLHAAGSLHHKPVLGHTRLPAYNEFVILLIDNYDSFTYNLVQRLGEMDARVDLRVVRNDKITLDEIAALKPSHIIISPGPCTPKKRASPMTCSSGFAPTIPTLGVCLGHQCIGHSFGGEVIRNYRVMHGKVSPSSTTTRASFAA